LAPTAERRLAGYRRTTSELMIDTASRRESIVLRRLATFCHRRRWTVLALWIVALVGVTVLAGRVGGAYSGGSNLAGTDSERAYQLLNESFPARSGYDATVVFAARDGFQAAATKTEVRRYLAEVTGLPGVTDVASPYDNPVQISPRHVAFATVSLDGDDSTIAATAARMQELAAPLRADGVTTEFGGGWFQSGSVPNSAGVGLLAAVLILLIAFGSVVAMGLPIITALFGVGIGLAGVSLVAGLVTTPDFTVEVASMIGLGVGIDYALFIVTRYRRALARTGSPEAAVGEAIYTAGRAVVFAGATVMVSLLGMLLMGLPLLRGLAIGSAAAVGVAVLAALTLLPALLGLVGRHLDRLSLHRRHGRHAGGPTRENFWHRWSRLVQRRPWPAAIGATAVLLTLAAPVLVMRLGAADEGNDPKGTTTRAAYDLLADGFGAGVNGPLLVAVRTPDGPAGAASLARAIAADPDVSYVAPPQASADGRAGLITVIPTTGPQAARTYDLVQHLRHDVIPAAERATGIEAHVGGDTASIIDFTTIFSHRLPLFIGSVLAISFLLLLVVFRSILVPLKAVVLNLLSIGAAYGVMVAIFQWGWFGSALGIGTGAPIEAWAPMMLFAIVFGLSMDYEVFLLSSIREEYDATGDNSRAVVEGLASTARLITAAAAIMVCVFGAFVLADLRAVKLIGLGLAVAVFVDATIVRMVLVPATMELLGDRNWWLPHRLGKVLPDLRVHPPEAPVAPSLQPAAGTRELVAVGR
jgi:putative drug exporter of the RND superfamily